MVRLCLWNGIAVTCGYVFPGHAAVKNLQLGLKWLLRYLTSQFSPKGEEGGSTANDFLCTRLPVPLWKRSKKNEMSIFRAESFLKDREDTLYFFSVHCH